MRQILILVGDLPKKRATRENIEPLHFQKVGPKSGQLKVIGLKYFIKPSRNTEMLVPTCVTTSKRIR
jgi:hypothetical protein